MSFSSSEIFCFDEFQLNLRTRTLERNGKSVTISPKAYELLSYFVQHPGRILGKEELLKAVWPNSFVEDSNLAQHVFALRKAFGDRSSYIVTVPGRGYQFTATVTQLPSAPAATSNVAATSNAAPNSSTSALEESPADSLSDAAAVDDPLPLVSTVASSLPASGRNRTAFRPSVLILSTVLALSIVAAAFWLHWAHRSSSAYRQVVLTDFANFTGDATFDRTLKRALEVDLAQSPYMDVLTEPAAVNTLRLMGRPIDTPVSVDVGREICERTNREVLLAGTISPVGQHYLLTLEGSDCTTGERVASGKAEAASREDVLEALDKIAEHVRRQLNEPRQSLETHEVPLRQATTSSLAALRAYSMGKYLQSQGQSRTECIAAFQRAVDLDPQFAMAYRELAVENSNLSQSDLGAQYYQRAFDLSGHLSTLEQLYIRAGYYSSKGDLIDAIKGWQLAATAYPQDPTPAGNIVDLYLRLGQYGPAVANGEHFAQLFPENPSIWENLAEAYKDVNRFSDSERATLRASQVGKGDTGLHLALFYIALARQDQPSIARENQWFSSHEDGSTVWYFPAFRGKSAAATGKFEQARRLFQEAHESAIRASLPETAEKILIAQAETEFDLGYPAAASATLQRIPQADRLSPDLVCLQAELGDIAQAEKFIAAHKSPTPDTLMTYVWLPRLHATVALQHGKPLDAIAALEPSRPYELRDYSIPWIRAEAYRKFGNPAAAATEYRKILDNPGIDPTDPLLSLAHLGLARALADNHQNLESRKQYEALFALWADADADLPLLRQARVEYAQLPH